MTPSKKRIFFLALIGFLGIQASGLHAEAPQIPEAYQIEPEENPYGTRVIPPDPEDYSPSGESTDAPAEMGTPDLEEEEEEESEESQSRLSLDTQKAPEPVNRPRGY